MRHLSTQLAHHQCWMHDFGGRMHLACREAITMCAHGELIMKKLIEHNRHIGARADFQDKLGNYFPIVICPNDISTLCNYY